LQTITLQCLLQVAEG